MSSDVARIKLPPEIWIARHGNREDFVDPDWGASASRPYDPPLSRDGRGQAEELAERMAKEKIDRIFASPFLRTIQTSWPICEKLNVSMALETGLMEWINPAWMQEFPPQLSNLELAPYAARIDSDYQSLIRPSFPETHDEVNERSRRLAQALVEKYSGSILLITHGAVMNSIIRSLTGMREYLNCHLACLSHLSFREGKWVLVINGDVSHLSGDATPLRYH